jgi:hypothetical protein
MKGGWEDEKMNDRWEGREGVRKGGRKGGRKE